jgi:hypothetical protein
MRPRAGPRAGALLRGGAQLPRRDKAGPDASLPGTASDRHPLPAVDRGKRCQPATESPGRLATPSVNDLVRLALQRAYERALDGEAEVTVRDAAALLRLQREIDREAARQAAGTIAQWEATMREVLWAARRHLGEHWKPFVADIRANQHLAAMWGPPPQKRAGDGQSR